MITCKLSRPIPCFASGVSRKYLVDRLSVAGNLAGPVKASLGQIEAVLAARPDLDGLILALPGSGRQIKYWELDGPARPKDLAAPVAIKFKTARFQPEEKPPVVPGFCFAWVPDRLNLVLLEEERNNIKAFGEGHGLPEVARTLFLCEPEKARWLENFFPWTYYATYQYLANPEEKHIDPRDAEKLGHLVFEAAWNLSGLNTSDPYGRLIRKLIPFSRTDRERIFDRMASQGPGLKKQISLEPALRKAVISYYEALAEIFYGLRIFGQRISKENDIIWGVGDEQEMAALTVCWQLIFGFNQPEIAGWYHDLTRKAPNWYLLGRAFRKIAQQDPTGAVSDYQNYLDISHLKNPERDVDRNKLLPVLWELAALEAQDLQKEVAEVKSKVGLSLERIDFWKYGQWYPLAAASLDLAPPKIGFQKP